MNRKLAFTAAATLGWLAAIMIPWLAKAAEPVTQKAGAQKVRTTVSAEKPKKPKRAPVKLTAVPVNRAEPVAGHAPSLLPAAKNWKMVWNDEFDGKTLTPEMELPAPLLATNPRPSPTKAWNWTAMAT